MATKEDINKLKEAYEDALQELNKTDIVYEVAQVKYSEAYEAFIDAQKIHRKTLQKYIEAYNAYHNALNDLKVKKG